MSRTAEYASLFRPTLRCPILAHRPSPRSNQRTPISLARHPRYDFLAMLLKIIAFIAAAVPIVLFVRSVFFRRSTRMSEGMKEFRKQADLAVWIFLGLVGCVVAFAAGKLLWTWWTAL